MYGADVSRSRHLLSQAIEEIADFVQKEQTEKYSVNYVSGPQPFTRLIIEGVFEFEDKDDLYLKALNLLAGFGDEYIYFDRATQQHLHSYLDKTIKSAGTIYDEQLQTVCSMIFSIPAMKSKIAFYRNEIFDLVHAYLSKNKGSFQKDKEVGKADYFFYLLEREEGAIYETDRRFFVNKIITSGMGELPYLKDLFLPHVLEKHLILYDPIHWKYIWSYLERDEENSIQKAIMIYTNPTVYQYTSNLLYIERLLGFLRQLKGKSYYIPLIQKRALEITTIIGRTLSLLKQTSDVHSQKQYRIIALCGELLKQDEIKAQMTGNIGRYQEPAAYCAYILQYYFSNDSEFDLGINYWAALEKDNLRKKLLEQIYAVFIRGGHLSKSDVDRIKDVTQQEFIRELYNYGERMKAYHFPFEKEKFLSLCDK